MERSTHLAVGMLLEEVLKGLPWLAEVVSSHDQSLPQAIH